ncbi:hypothetical protein CPB85DRAFT_1376447 [Mucidula mucida]|nr:hypothetical protein CPB85DRAFT_1376447 [Mucidula mucida]
MASIIPDRVQALVIGGGPAGAYAAACLAREGIQTCSMMVALRHFLRFIDLEERFEKHGSMSSGSEIHIPLLDTDFVARDPSNYLRSEADELLLRHAASEGALVFEETKVDEVTFEGIGLDARPVSARWKDKAGKTGVIAFDWLVDASGRNGLLSTKNLKNRKYNQSLKNVACWGYWKGTGTYSPQTSRRGSPWFEALTDESGWAWFIPLHNGVTSIGILAPDIIAFIREGTLMEEGFDGPVIRSASDYSYAASYYAGPHYRLAGDAAAFIDPFFSSGVHLALSSGLSAAATIVASIRGDCSEEEACRWHTSKVGTSYTRFLVVVLSAYRQMHAQNHPVLSDVDEDNFDRAFEHFRPIIQGHSDVATMEFSAELRQTIDFCAHAFEPSEPEPEQLGEGDVAPALKPVAKPEEIDKELAGLDKDSKRVFENVSSRGEMNNSDFEHMDNLVSDRFHGLSLRLKRGSLGLQKA